MGGIWLEWVGMGSKGLECVRGLEYFVMAGNGLKWVGIS